MTKLLAIGIIAGGLFAGAATAAVLGDSQEPAPDSIQTETPAPTASPEPVEPTPETTPEPQESAVPGDPQPEQPPARPPLNSRVYTDENGNTRYEATGRQKPQRGESGGSNPYEVAP